MICNLGVVGSNPTRGSRKDAEKLLFFESKLGKYQSGQMGQTVNLLAYAFGGSNPSLPTQKERRTGCLYFRVDREGETPCGAFLRK